MDIFYLILVLLAIVIVSYLLGSLSTSLIIGKIYGIDIRKYGSHNAGGTNVGRVISKKAGIITIVIDILKGFILSLVVFLIFTYANLSSIYTFLHLKELAISLSAIFLCLGHSFPIYYNFKGGKAVSCFAGYILFISPIIFVLGCVIFFTLFALFKKISLSSVIAVPSIILLFLVPVILDLTILPDIDSFNGGMYFASNSLLHLTYISLITIFLLALLIVLRHLSNIKRLERGEEPETKFK